MAPNKSKAKEAAEATAATKQEATPYTCPAASKGCPRLNQICDTVLDAIGSTPMVRIHHIGSDLPCEILAKCEFFNAGGSVKDRIGRQMVLDAEKSGRIKPGDTLIEPTSGNTGIGIALAAAVKGYRCIITMPEKMSKEKVDVLKALGAEIFRTPTEAAYDAPDSHISVARRLQTEIPNSHILDQYSNPSNPNAHYSGTAQEIIQQCGGQVDMLVAGVGTGGTITGIAKRLREHNPNIIIVGVDPEGSILAVPEQLNDKKRLEAYQVEGIGYDFIPQVLERDTIDQWYKSNDAESLLMMRKLIRDEGLLCGGSCGAAMSVAIKAAKSLKAGQRCVVILPDSVRNYMSKALSDDWMTDQGYVDGDVIKAKSYQTWWATKKVYDLPINTPLTITADVLCKDAIALLKQEGFDMVPVLDDGCVIGVVTEGNMTNRLLSGRCAPDTTVLAAGVVYKTFHKFGMNATLADIAHALDHDPVVLIVTEQRCFSGAKRLKPNVNVNADTASDDGSKGSTGGDHGSGRSTQHVVTRSVVSGIVSRIDLLDYISSGGGGQQ
jgi:cystathionine beta-synthase